MASIAATPASIEASAQESQAERERQIVRVVTIDAFVRSQRLPHVDFIKMDIEGAELDALAGARKTIQRDRPKLAISIYHSHTDFIEIPRLVKGLAPEYRLEIGQHGPGLTETVLYAC